MPSTASSSLPAVPVARRVSGFTYAIRNIVAEAKKVEAAGTPSATSTSAIRFRSGLRRRRTSSRRSTARRAIRRTATRRRPASCPAREAVADDFTARGFPVDADRVILTSGTSEGIELTLGALVEEGDEVLVPVPTYPLYTAVLAKIGARTVYYRTDPARDWQPDVDHVRSLITPRTRALVLIDPNNPTGAVYPRETKLALIDIAEAARHSHPLGRGVWRSRVRRAGRTARQAASGRGDHRVFVAVEGLHRARLARRLDGRRRDAAARRRARRHQEAGGRPAVQPRADAVRDRGGAARRSIASARLQRGAGSCARG